MSKITEWSSAIKENKWLVILIIGFFTSAAGNVYMFPYEEVTHKEPPQKVIEKTIIKKDSCEKLISKHREKYH